MFPPFSLFLSLRKHISLFYNQILSFPLLPSLNLFPSRPPSIARSVEVALLIGISVASAPSLSPSLPPSFSPPFSLAQCVLGLMQLGRYLGQHQSFIHTPHTHTHKTVHIAALPKCLSAGAEGGYGRDEYKNNFFPPPLPAVLPLWFDMQGRLCQTLHCHETLIHFQSGTVFRNNLL